MTLGCNELLGTIDVGRYHFKNTIFQLHDFYALKYDVNYHGYLCLEPFIWSDREDLQRTDQEWMVYVLEEFALINK